MKIAIVLPSLAGGGAEKLNLYLAKDWINKGFSVDIIILNSFESGSALLDLVPKKANLIDLQVKKIRSSFIPLCKIFMKGKYNFILAAMWPLTLVCCTAKLTIFSKSKLILSEHTTLSISRVHEFNASKFTLSLSIAIFYRLANNIIAVSNGVAADLSSIGFLKRKKIKVIYNPASFGDKNISNHKSPNNKNLWLPDAKFRFLGVGSLKKQKNFRNLLNAFNLLDEEILKYSQLIILGEGPERDDLESYIYEHNLEDRVSLLGYKSDPYPWFNSASVFVLSSSWEGFGNVIVEAMECRLPIVSTDCPHGPREILDDGKHGILVEVDNPNALAEGMMSAIRDKHNLDLIYKRSQDFRIDKISNQYIEVFKGKS